MWDRFLEVYTLDNYPLLIVTALNFFFGGLTYAMAVRQIVKRGISPFPFWLHPFFLAHDSSLAVRALIGAWENEWHWFLVGASIGLFAWTFQEIFVIYHAITNDAHRQDIWGIYRPLNKGRVSKWDAAGSALGQVIGWYCIFNLVTDRFAPESAMLDCFILSIIAQAWAPNWLWRKRTSREYNSTGFALAIVLATIDAFYPWNMWSMAFPDLYDTFWYRAVGVVTIGASIANMKIVMDLPEKAAVEEANGKIKGV